MPITYDPTTAAGQVRLLAVDTVDTATSPATFSDAEIAQFLAMNGDNILLAAAMALDTTAANAAKVQGVTTFAGVSLNGQLVAAALSSQAARLREQAYSGGDDAPFAIAEWVVDEWTYRERLVSQMYRSG